MAERARFEALRDALAVQPRVTVRVAYAGAQTWATAVGVASPRRGGRRVVVELAGARLEVAWDDVREVRL